MGVVEIFGGLGNVLLGLAVWGGIGVAAGGKALVTKAPHAVVCQVRRGITAGHSRCRGRQLRIVMQPAIAQYSTINSEGDSK